MNSKREDEIRTDDDLINFISKLPSSVPILGLVSKYLPYEVLDTRVEKILNTRAIMHLFEKYRIYPEDRKKIIESILNLLVMK